MKLIKIKFDIKIFFVVFLSFSFSAEAFLSEVGVSYTRRKTTFDANNYIESESTTGSYSIYFFEFLALEMSYTNAVGVRLEKASPTDLKRTIEQTTSVKGADLILVLAKKSSFFQPYIKGGAAEISRVQKISTEGAGEQTLNPETAIVPSYGAGLKFGVTQQFNIKLSYEIWKTPIGGDLSSDDSALRLGLSWYL
ncbi:MAG TPA: outer membrane beta-barrel protein [Pseudobdellovibrionaceae bacterium]|nr:outer membrane beta-barrel protein [Pseudobdellovibrionaceae bacterium]